MEVMKRRTILASIGVMTTSGCLDAVTEVSSGGKSLEETVNSHAVADAIHQAVNEKRVEHDVAEIGHDDKLASIAEDHSEDMVNNDFFSHTAPDGSSFEQRYQEAGYECRIPISNNRYLSGAENIGYTWADQDVKTEGDDTVNHDNDEDSIGQGIVRQWMNSPPHRENILQQTWSVEGIGVAVDEEAEDGKKVIATQNFC